MNWLPYVYLLVGLLSRVFVPWLAKRRKDPSAAKWGWKYFWPQVISFVLIVLLLPVLINDLDLVASLAPQAAWLAGWAVGDIGRQTYKAFADEEPEW